MMKNTFEMKKIGKRMRAVLAMSLTLSLALSGCGKSGQEEQQDTPETVTDAASETTDTASETDAAGSTDQAQDTAAKPGLTPEDVPYINMEYINHPAMLYGDNDIELVNGAYYEFIPDDDAREAYPVFAKTIEDLNKDIYSETVSYMQGMEAASLQLRDDGWEYPFDAFRTVTVNRADQKAFSYVVLCEDYQGGAHGYAYYLTKNIDTVTGEEIDFHDVVTDTTDFEQIAFDELLNSNDSLVEYFGMLKEDKTNLLERIKESISGDEPTIAWNLTYEGIEVYYEDYAMGSYAAGSQSETIRFADYPEIFNADYFTYDGKTAESADIPKIEDHVKEKTDSETARIPQGPVPMKDVYNSIYSEAEFESLPYIEGLCEKREVTGDYPALQKALEQYNSDNEKKMSKGFKSYITDVKNEYKDKYLSGTKADDYGEYDIYDYGIALYQNRADDVVFSMTESLYEEHVSVDSFRQLTGVNFDTQTGEAISLSDVVTDTADFTSAVEDKIKKEGYIRDVENKILTEFKAQMGSNDLVSNPKFSWTLGYEGITVYFNTTVNYDVFGVQDTAFNVFVPFAEHEGLFNEKYLETPEMYVIEVPVSDKFADSVTLDTSDNGDYMRYSFEPVMDQYGYVNSLKVENDKDKSEIENLYATNVRTFIVSGAYGEKYIYLQCPIEDGYTNIRILWTGAEGEVYEGVEDGISGEVQYTSGEDTDELTRGYTMTSTRGFRLRDDDTFFGVRDVYATCRLDLDGTPLPMDGFWYYRQDPDMNLKTLKSIEVSTVDGDGNESDKKVTLPEGTELSPYRVSVKTKLGYGSASADYTPSDYERTVDLTASDGTVYRIHLESEDGYDYNVNGETLQDIFEGWFVYAG